MDQPVPGQIRQGLRHPVTGQVGGAGAVDLAIVAKRPRHQAGGLQRSHPHHAVEAVAHQIHPPVRTAQHQLQVGVLRQEGGQRRDHQMARHPARHVHPQLPRDLAPLAKQAVKLLHVRQQIPAPGVAELAIRGELHPPGGAQQEPGAHALLQPADGGGEGRLGDAQLLGATGETLEFGDPHEQFHRIQLIHGLIVSSNGTVISLSRYLSGNKGTIQ